MSLLLIAIASAGCQQQMADQPSYRPARESPFFADHRASRPLVQGTVPRGSTVDSGRKAWQRTDLARVAGIISVAGVDPLMAASATAELSLYIDAFPTPMTLAMLERGQQRFDIYCSVCHDRVGDGNGIIVQRGFTKPPSFHTDNSRGFKLKGSEVKLRDVPVGYVFEVVSNGLGAMPDYAEQVPAKDRWAIVAYIRALQLSQNARLADVENTAERSRLLTLRKASP